MSRSRAARPRFAMHIVCLPRRGAAIVVPELSVEQIADSSPSPSTASWRRARSTTASLAALAVKQARGDLIEAIFLVRAYRTTLPRFGNASRSTPTRCVIERRISATFKDLPGGQLLGPTFDYTHRLLEPDRMAGDDSAAARRAGGRSGGRAGPARHRSSRPRGPDRAGRRRATERTVGDLTREPLAFPADRDIRLQALARGDEGFLLALGYSTQRGYGRTHPFAGEIRIGEVEVEVDVPELGFAVCIGRDHGHRVPDGQPVQGKRRDAAAVHPRLRPGLRAFRAQGDGDGARRPGARAPRVRRGADWLRRRTRNSCCRTADNVQATGFVEHLKLPHYVDFQAELDAAAAAPRESTRRGMPTHRDAEAAE